MRKNAFEAIPKEPRALTMCAAAPANSVQLLPKPFGGVTPRVMNRENQEYVALSLAVSFDQIGFGNRSESSGVTRTA